MASASDAWQALGGRRSRRGSRDYSDEALQQAFNEIDSDKSGHIDREELEKVRSPTQNPSAYSTRNDTTNCHTVEPRQTAILSILRRRS